MSNQCSAITNALIAKGYDNARLANQAGLTVQRVSEILSGNSKPSQQEFGAIASALGLSNPPKHAAQVTA